MKDKLIQIRVDAEFLEKLEYLRSINGFKSISETIRKIAYKEFRKETVDTPNGKWVETPSRAEIKCSQCEAVFNSALYYRNFCPNCGARMK